jgi:hypothetical protein
MRKFFKRRRRENNVAKKKRHRKLRTAGLALGLATAWGAETQADVTLRLELTPQQTLTNAYVLYNNNVSTGLFKFLGIVPGGQTTVFLHELRDGEVLSDWQSQPESYTSSGNYPAVYSIIALYGSGPETGVTVSFPNDDVVTQGKTWDELFNPAPPFGYDRADIISDLQTNVPPYEAFSLLDDYTKYPPYSTLLNTEYGSYATLVNFSTATFGGTALARVLPEPAGWILFVSAAGVACALRRRRDS